MDFIDVLVIQDKTLVPHIDFESKAEARQSKHSDLPAPKKFRGQQSA